MFFGFFFSWRNTLSQGPCIKNITIPLVNCSSHFATAQANMYVPVTFWNACSVKPIFCLCFCQYIFILRFEMWWYMPTFCFLLFKNSFFGEGTLHFLIKNRIILPFTHSFTHRETGYDWNENQLGETWRDSILESSNS